MVRALCLIKETAPLTLCWINIDHPEHILRPRRPHPPEALIFCLPVIDPSHVQGLIELVLQHQTSAHSFQWLQPLWLGQRCFLTQTSNKRWVMQTHGQTDERGTFQATPGNTSGRCQVDCGLWPSWTDHM